MIDKDAGEAMADRRHDRAVTLVEMLVVLGVIAVLASLVVTLALRIDTQSKERVLDNAFALLATSLREYYEFRDAFPVQSELDPNSAVLHIEGMVQELRSVPDSRQVLDQLNRTLIQNKTGVLDVPELKDPWGTVLDYVYDPNEGDRFPELISAGPDKRFGTEDDIRSKSRQKK